MNEIISQSRIDNIFFFWIEINPRSRFRVDTIWLKEILNDERSFFKHFFLNSYNTKPDRKMALKKDKIFILGKIMFIKQ